MSLSVETVAGVGLQLAKEEGRGQRQYGEGCGSGRGRRLWRQREERPTVQGDQYDDDGDDDNVDDDGGGDDDDKRSGHKITVGTPMIAALIPD
ncbi:hypothetical protein BHM03_00050766 [Ensete ventricosum]|nr:hypothetical protein BHM03_00050766 [Ensete ventricosum]